MLNLERIAALIFSVEHDIADEKSKLIPNELADALVIVLRGNQRLMMLLGDYFSTGKLIDSASNYEVDVIELEKILQSHVPESLDLLDMNDKYTRMVAIVRDVKDMRDILLKLLLALPAT